MSRSTALRFAALAGALVLAAGAAAAQVLVISARGPSAGAYPPGKVLASARSITLKAGDRLEVLEGGGSRVLTGPGVYAAGRLDKPSEARLIDILSHTRTESAGIAATRGFELTSPEDVEGVSLWQVDTATGGPLCVAGGEAPVFFSRASDDAPRPVTVVRLATGESRPIAWVPGTAVAGWPGDLPLNDGESARIDMSDGSSATITWRTIAGSTDLVALAAELADHGCQVQLARLKAITHF